MTAFTQETKSQLAKLLATENIRIEHKKMPTAAFDPKNRVLYCPIWKNMSGYMYDLLMGHEVGHALYTPADGWHDAACSNGKNFKSFLNVVEDARIEKKIKRKYPGLRSSFVTAYKELMQKDFFGLGGRDINKMSFINRLNIYTKSDYTANIQFGAKEKELVDRVRAVESWEDVIKITGEVFAYAKEEQEENEDLQWQFPPSSGFGDEDGDDSDDYGDSSDFGDEIPGQDGNNSDSSEDSGEEGDQDGTTKSDSEEKTEDGDVDEFGDEINHEKYSEEYDGVMGEPTCETDNNFRRRELELLDDKSKDYVYVSFPTPNLEKIVTPAARVHELITNYYQNNYSEGTYFETKLTQLCDEFKKKNEKYVSLLAKEFEMRKAASKFSKAKIATTGDIDISRLYKYQVDDNIFRKTMKVPKGKSHGLVMMFDRSGSMNENMKGSIEQMLVIAMFCRKVNIPFVVYGFGNNIQGRAIDFPEETYKRFEMFSKGVNELAIGGVFLREYMNSKMSNAEFSKVFRNMVALMNSYGSFRSGREFSMPLSEDLSNTPMNEAFIALEPVTQQFRKVNNLDIVNTVLIHDGDSDWFRGHFFVNPENNNGISTSSYYVNQENVFVVDKKLKKEFRLTSDDDMQRLVMDWYTAKTGSKIFGFFIGGSSHGYMKNMIWNGYVDEKGEGFTRPTNWEEKVVVDEKIKSLVKIMKKEKFLTSYKKGYNKFFLIAGGKELEINDGEFEFQSESEKVSAKKLATAFMKFNEKRQVNRVLVQKFIEGIAI